METVMEDLNRLTADELIRLHNARAGASARIEGPWKRSKRDLIDCIRALGEPEPAEHQVDATERTAAGEAKTVGAMVEVLVVTDLPYDEIVCLVKERFPEARTTARSAASVASVMRNRGVAVPFRKKASV
jgi:hypothetical protein